MIQPFRNRLKDRSGVKNWPLWSSVPNRFEYQVLGEVRAMVLASKLNVTELRSRILIVVRLINFAAGASRVGKSHGNTDKMYASRWRPL